MPGAGGGEEEKVSDAPCRAPLISGAQYAPLHSAPLPARGTV